MDFNRFQLLNLFRLPNSLRWPFETFFFSFLKSQYLWRMFRRDIGFRFHRHVYKREFNLIGDFLGNICDKLAINIFASVVGKSL